MCGSIRAPVGEHTHTHTPLCPADTVLQRTVCVCVGQTDTMLADS